MMMINFSEEGFEGEEEKVCFGQCLRAYAYALALCCALHHMMWGGGCRVCYDFQIITEKHLVNALLLLHHTHTVPVAAAVQPFRRGGALFFCVFDIRFGS